MLSIHTSKPDLFKNSPSYILYLKWKKEVLSNEDTKVFICDWNYPDVSNALISRGWHQNKDDASQFFDLKYARKARIPDNLKDWQVLNHFPRNFELSAKWNLAGNMCKKSDKRFLKSEEYFPRCFQMENKGLQIFQVNYKIQYAVSLLKKFEDGDTVEFEKVLASLDIVERIISWGDKELKLSLVKSSEWSLLTSSATGNEPSPCTETMLTTLNRTKLLLSTLQSINPQYSMNGKQNIWIIKPGRKSRGRDIKILSDLEEILKYIEVPNFWVAQKYIENPLLINNRKFDIRQWVLITNMDPIEIWVYNRCYLRFAAEEFSFDELSNNFRHLTNNSISKDSNDFVKSNSMWFCEEFQEYLCGMYGRDVWNEEIFQRIKDICKAVLRTPGKLVRKNSFELLGLDLMVSTDLKVWLLEINTSPAMDYSTVI